VLIFVIVSASYWKNSFFVLFQKSSLIGQFKFNREEIQPIKTLQSKRRVDAFILKIMTVSELVRDHCYFYPVSRGTDTPKSESKHPISSFRIRGRGNRIQEFKKFSGEKKKQIKTAAKINDPGL
jgi:hypothetical protein